MQGIDATVRMCSNAARIDNFMKLINLNFYVSKEFTNNENIIKKTPKLFGFKTPPSTV